MKKIDQERIMRRDSQFNLNAAVDTRDKELLPGEAASNGCGGGEKAEGGPAMA
jgi:hypothetical protein